MTDHSLAGHFLVASRYLRDPNFVHSVVLMIHHDHQGAMGVVINRPSDKTVQEVWEIIGNDPCDREDLIYVGGPVPGPLVALHAEEEFADAEVLPDLYCSTNRDALDRLVRETEVRLKLCSGNAGWASGQLESELEAGGWLSTKATIEEVFAEYDSIWKSVTQRIGLQIMAPDIDSDHMPPDPSLN